jgi:replicative DNA helicase
MNKPFTPPLRQSPHNIEAEQALLGAILINNEAFYRVSDFLESRHFFEPIHRQIFEVISGLVRANKIATPVTLKTFLPSDADIAGLSLDRYLARLAAEATTIINAEDYGRTIYDLSIRRDLIIIGEDIVNLAYDAPVDAPPRSQIEEAERNLYAIAEQGHHATGFQRFFRGADERGRHGRARLSARRQVVRIGDRLGRPRRPHGWLAAVGPHRSGRPSRYG